MKQSDKSEATDVEFSSLILGFSSAALYYMAQVPLKDRKPAEINLPLASQNINIIAMLQEKTKGNLSPEEDHLIVQLLTDLKVKFVETTNAKK